MEDGQKYRSRHLVAEAAEGAQSFPKAKARRSMK
jgi:hypothetical protein